MDQSELDAKWEAALTATFNTFIKDNIGYKEVDGQEAPECYGTGDDRSYCVRCDFQPTC